MALSGKTLELNTVTTQLLYNRGVSLFSSVTYFPAFSTLSNGAFASWALYPLSTTFQSSFYGYTSFDSFYQAINTISTNNTNVSTTLSLMTSTTQIFSTSTSEVLTLFSNMPISTISSFTYQSDQLLRSSLQNNSTLSNFSTYQVSGISFWLSEDPPYLLSTLFYPNSNTMIDLAQDKYGYIQISGKYNSTLVAGYRSNALPLITNSTIYATGDSYNFIEPIKQPDFETTYAIGFNNSYFLATGISTNYAHFAISPDGLQWSSFAASTNMPLGITGIPTSLAGNESVWVLGTSNATGDENLFFSYDGYFWSTVNYNPLIIGALLPQKLSEVNSVGWNGNSFCLTGNPAPGQAQPVLLSPDGLNWYGTNVFYTLGFERGEKVAAHNGGWFVGGGSNAGMGLARLIHLSTMYNPTTDQIYQDWYTIASANSFDLSVMGLGSLNNVTAIAVHNNTIALGIQNVANTISLGFISTIQENANVSVFDYPAKWFDPVKDIVYTGYDWLAGGNPGVFPLDNSLARSQDGYTWIGDGISTFITIRSFLNFNPDPNRSIQGSNRIQFGVSSFISTLYTPEWFDLISTTPDTLSNSSSFWGYYESTSHGTIDALGVRIDTEGPFLIDSGSTLNDLISSSSVELQSSITNQFFGGDVSTFSTFFFPDFNNFDVAELSTDVTQFSNATRIQMLIFNSQMISTYKTNGASNSINTFYNLASTQLVAASNDFNQYNGLPGFERIAQQNSSIIVPFLTILSVSTNQSGYVGLSTFAHSSLSSFSSLFPFILASSLFHNLNVLNSNISSLSSLGPVQVSSFLSLHDSFITGPQVSSLELLLSTGISTSFNDYSQIISTQNSVFSSAYQNINVVPGLCTLAASTLECFSSLNVSTPEILDFLYNKFLQSTTFIGQEYSTVYSQIANNLSSYVSSIETYSTLSSIAYLYSTQVAFDTYFVSSQNAPGGYLDSQLSSILQIPGQTLQTVIPFFGSTLFFSTFPGISTYYLSNDGTIARSTSFDSIRTSTVIGANDLRIRFLGVEVNYSELYPMNVRGSLYMSPGFISSIPPGPPTPTPFDGSFVLGSGSNAWSLTYSSGIEYKRNLFGLTNPDYPMPDPMNQYLSSSRFGAAVDGENIIIPTKYETIFPPAPVQNAKIYKLNVIPISSSILPYPLYSNVNVGLSTFYDYTGIPLYFQLNEQYQVQFKNLSNVNFFSQFDNMVLPSKNILLYNLQLGPSFIQSNYYVFPTVTDTVTATMYRTLGPLTSLTSNGTVSLFTATSNSFTPNYGTTSFMWNVLPPGGGENFYTMVVTSNLDIANTPLPNISTLLQLDTGYIPSIYDALWTGTTWLAVGQGVFQSQDGLAWSTIMPSNVEPHLGYRSIDTNGTDIFIAELSTSPTLVALKKSSDDGQTWSHVSSIEVPNILNPFYMDIGTNSTSLYTPTIKWAYNRWNLAVACLTGPQNVPLYLYQSEDNGNLWTGTSISPSPGIDDVLPGCPHPDFVTGKFSFVPTDLNAGSPPAPTPAFDPSSITSSLTTIQMPNFQIYANEYNNVASTLTLQIYASSIYFTSSISLRQVTNSIQRGQLSINTSPQNYAVDLGFGDARKPAGSLWLSPSDQRIKEHIQSPDFNVLIDTFEKIRLVKFQYTKAYQEKHGVSSDSQYGFLSQEIKELFPQAVSVDTRDDIQDFESLDMDQLYYTKLAITQSLLCRISSLTRRIENLR